MILNLDANGTLRLAGAERLAIEVLDGRVWLTRKGRREDAILARGSRCEVAGEDVVLVGLERRARLELRAAGRAPWWRHLLRTWSRAIEERRAAEALARLPDRMLRDMGLSRDRIREVV
ncbi:MAG: DUF2917 domain-containing protein [Burkholderiales bacterium]